MKLSTNQEEFLKALNICLKAVSLKPNLPILANILISLKGGKIKLAATNLEIAITTFVNGKVETEGETTTPAKVLFDYVSSLPKEDLELEMTDNNLFIRSKKSEAKFSTVSPAEFPVIPKIENNNLTNLESDYLSKAFEQVVFASASDEGRMVLTGVLMEAVKDKTILVATDGYRLSYRKISLDTKKQQFKIIIPAKTIYELIKIITETKIDKVGFVITKSSNQIIFKIGETEIVSRLIDGDYPAWEKILPADFKTNVVFDKDEFLQAVRTAAVFARDAGNVVRIDLSNGKTTFAASAKELGEGQVSVDTKTDGQGGQIAFNYRYLVDILNNLNGDKFKFEMIESLNPVKFSEVTKGDPDFFHIIMPVRVQN